MNKNFNRYLKFATNVDNIIFVIIMYMLFKNIYIGDYSEVVFISVIFIAQLFFSKRNREEDKRNN